MPVRKCSNGKYKIGTGQCEYKSKASAERAYKGYLGSKFAEGEEMVSEVSYPGVAGPNQENITATDIQNHGNTDLVTFKLNGIDNVPFAMSGTNQVAVPAGSVKQGTRYIADKVNGGLAYPKEIHALTLGDRAPNTNPVGDDMSNQQSNESAELNRLKALSGLMEKTVLKTMEEDDENKISAKDIPQQMQRAKIEKKIDDDREEGKYDFKGMLTNVAKGNMTVKEQEELDRLLKMSGQKPNEYGEQSPYVFENDEPFGFIKSLNENDEEDMDDDEDTDLEEGEVVQGPWKQEVHNLPPRNMPDTAEIADWYHEIHDPRGNLDDDMIIDMLVKRAAEEYGLDPEEAYDEIYNIVTDFLDNGVTEGDVVQGPWTGVVSHGEPNDTDAEIVTGPWKAHDRHEPDEKEIMDYYRKSPGEHDEKMWELLGHLIHDHGLSDDRAAELIANAFDNEHKSHNESQIDEVAPKGWEGTVKAMKKHRDMIDNPYALANYMKNKGYHSHVHEDMCPECGHSPCICEGMDEACPHCGHLPCTCEGTLEEKKWIHTDPSKKGMFNGKNLSDIEHEISSLKKKDAKTHDRGDKVSDHDRTRMHQLQFAKRAKQHNLGEDDTFENFEPAIFTKESLDRYMVEMILDEMKNGLTPEEISEALAFDFNHVNYIVEFIQDAKEINEADYDTLSRRHDSMKKDMSHRDPSDFDPREMNRFRKIEKRLKHLKNKRDFDDDNY